MHRAISPQLLSELCKKLQWLLNGTKQANGEPLTNDVGLEVLSYHPFALPDQEDDEDHQHDGSQCDNNEREVGHHTDDQQQLLYSQRRRVVNQHTLGRDEGEDMLCVTGD